MTRKLRSLDDLFVNKTRNSPKLPINNRMKTAERRDIGNLCHIDNDE